MISVSVENYKGEKLQLTNSEYFDITNVTGLNPQTASIIFTELAGMDGSRYNSGRIPKRNIVITLCYKPPIEENRNMIYRFFAPNSAVRLYFETDSKSVYIDGYTEANEVGLFTRSQQSQISIICPNPYFKSAAGINVNFSDTISLFEFPFSIPAAGIEFSKITKRSNVVINAGEIATGAIFTLTARTSQILNPKIYNNTTNEFFGLDVDLDAGDVVTINTNAGEKAVMLRHNGAISNIISSRQSGSKWLQLISGENEISYSCDEGAENLAVNVRSAACYWGL
ncbi:phage distal tail protein [Ruminococcus sp. 210702-SL.1.03]|jgi:hypothetical protein|uniref:phage distal tail protein n=1 Tax=Ruminococcus sp. 210702-SL.1.03 TaxID=2883233 RepID=UPI001D088A46|nr:phage tail domain-containing protein [Ruminococcus sp. 210702-SL.1.03]MCB6616072.1 phage tail family protein [Ruminococcus sp. 210702-SL.1.03]